MITPKIDRLRLVRTIAEEVNPDGGVNAPVAWILGKAIRIVNSEEGDIKHNFDVKRAGRILDKLGEIVGEESKLGNTGMVISRENIKTVRKKLLGEEE